MAFKDKKETKKGDIGELIVRDWLEKNNYLVYSLNENKAHWFDFLCTEGKKKAFAIDVKTKARLNKWPAQGIDKKHFKDYLRYSEMYNMDFYLIFVDDKTGDVHKADINKLKDKYFEVNDNLVAWYLSDMDKLFTISKEEIEQLSFYDTRNYEFKPNKL